ncbi:MAG: hypothetical protein JW771_01480 [Candidatus Thermoplasmatota archaeon]|nr:hypothetical protein [Candidatus Thermoplasmatota archaeon]
MELNLSATVKQVMTALLLFILPLIILGIGALTGVENAWYYLISIVWFGLGVILFGAIEA